MKHRFRHTINIIFQLAALVVAANYFCFQVEIFEDEYEKNNPLPSPVPSITYSEFNWESFDKTNAPKAFVFVVPGEFILLCLRPPELLCDLPALKPIIVIRDKSQPTVNPFRTDATCAILRQPEFRA